jgi:hypothetical protein
MRHAKNKGREGQNQVITKGKWQPQREPKKESQTERREIRMMYKNRFRKRQNILIDKLRRR